MKVPLLFLFVSLAIQLINSQSTTNHIEVFIIAHSHDDVGWIMPWEEYYTTEVRSILNTVTQSLDLDPKRKYTQVEVAFFRRWWNEVNEETRDKVRKFIRNGQLEFNIGGITMNDESCPVYNQEINQMTDGQQWLLDTLGAKPASAWHIDPFGHSAATASLWSQIGFPGFGINRIPYRIKDYMKANKGLEFVWRGSKSLGKNTEIWTHVMDSHYYPPAEMKFDEGWDVEQVGNAVVQGMRERQAWYRHNKQLITWGGDFFHQDAVTDYANMDKLMNYINNKPEFNMTLKYSFFSDYIKAVHDLNLTWDVFEGDFFPYWDDDHTFWTGYYTSKPWFKQYLRECDTLLSTAESLYALSFSNGLVQKYPSWGQNIESLRSATAIATHHDAVSGTENDWTEKDYISALKNSSSLVRKSLREMIPVLARSKPRSNQSRTTFQYAVQNPLAWSRKQVVSLVTNYSSAVVKFRGRTVVSQTNPVPSFSKVEGKYRLYFLANLGPLATQIYDITFSNQTDKSVTVTNGVSSLETRELSLQFDKSTGKLSGIKNNINGNVVQASLDYLQYFSEAYESPPSGAYIFRPASPSRINPLKSNVQFLEEFSTIPHIFTTPSISSETVTGSSSRYHASLVHSVDSKGFKTHFYGEKHSSLSSDFAAWEDFPLKDSFPRANYALGRAQLKDYSNEVVVYYKEATKRIGEFAQKPVIVVSAHSSKEASISATVSMITPQSFKIILSKNCKDLKDIYVDWFAIHNSNLNLENSNEYLYAGTIELNGKSKILVDHPDASSDSMILLSLESSDGNTYNVYVNGRGSNHFSASVKGLEEHLISEGMKLHYVVAPREVMTEQVAKKVSSKRVDGPLVTEIQQSYRKNYGQTFVAYKTPLLTDRGVIDIVSEVGPLSPQGRELVTRIQTSLNNSGIFYTDDNGMEIMKRTLDRTLPEPIAGNYYPMVQRTFIRDEAKNLQLTFNSNSVHGVSSLKNGQLEVMLHRRCLSDDAKGVDEVLNDLTPIRTSLWLSLSDVQDATKKHRSLAIFQQFPPTILKLDGLYNTTGFVNFTMPKLPHNVHMVTLKEFSGKLLVRLHHIFAKGEHPVYSQPVQLNLQMILQNFKVKSITEMNLSGNTPLNQLNKLEWNTRKPSNGYTPIPLNGDILTIQPLEMRTILVELA